VFWVASKAIQDFIIAVGGDKDDSLTAGNLVWLKNSVTSRRSAK